MPEIGGEKQIHHAAERLPAQPEQYPEQATERGREHYSDKKENTRSSVSTVQSSALPESAESRLASDAELHAIENILEEGLGGFFGGLTPEKQLEFKAEGESTALKIKQALMSKATRLRDIVNLIVSWLRKLPGINRFFLEQEAKIKADKIIGRFRP